MKRFNTDTRVCNCGEDIVKKEGVLVIALEFNIFNLGDKNIFVRLNESEDKLLLEAGEGFSTNVGVESCEILTDGAVIKYSYWN